MSNNTLHYDPKIQTIPELAFNIYTHFHNNIHNHINLLISKLSSLTLPYNPTRHLKQKWPRDLLNS